MNEEQVREWHHQLRREQYRARLAGHDRITPAEAFGLIGGTDYDTRAAEAVWSILVSNGFQPDWVQGTWVRTA
jgi:hypothetical protein